VGLQGPRVVLNVGSGTSTLSLCSLTVGSPWLCKVLDVGNGQASSSYGLPHWRWPSLIIIWFATLVMAKPHPHVVCHMDAGILSSLQCSDVAGKSYGKGELDRGGGKKRRIVNELHGLWLILQLYLMGLPLLGSPLHSYNPSAAIYDLGRSAHIT